MKDLRARAGGIRFKALVALTPLPSPTGPLRVTVFLAADADAGSRGECVAHTFPASACGTRRATFRCR